MVKLQIDDKRLHEEQVLYSAKLGSIYLLTEIQDPMLLLQNKNYRLHSLRATHVYRKHNPAVC